MMQTILVVKGPILADNYLVCSWQKSLARNQKLSTHSCMAINVFISSILQLCTHHPDSLNNAPSRLRNTLVNKLYSALNFDSMCKTDLACQWIVMKSLLSCLIHLAIHIQTTSEGGLLQLDLTQRKLCMDRSNSDQFALNVHYFHHVDRHL